MTERQVLVHRDPQLLAAATAARLITTMIDAQSAGGSISLALTGGSLGIEVLRQVSASSARDAVDWKRVDLYWGDERFLPAGDPERNEAQARGVLLDHVPVDTSRVRPMACSDGEFGDDVDAAAEAYQRDLPASLDLCLLGVGEEGHVASVFPDSPAAFETQRRVVPVRDSPKPPPTRISLSLPTIRRAAEVWLITAGDSKATAVAAALADPTGVALPAAGAQGHLRTRWLIDEAAAANLPAAHPPPES